MGLVSGDMKRIVRGKYALVSSRRFAPTALRISLPRAPQPSCAG
jgi:hypothetical protein